MLDDAFADGEGEVESAVGGVALFKVRDDAEGVEVVIEGEAVTAERCVEGLFAGVSVGRVADVVYEGERLSEVDVEAEDFGDGAGDLRDFEGVCESAAEVVAGELTGLAGEDLGFAGEAAEGAGVEDAAAVADEVGAVGVGGFGMRAGGEGRGVRNGESGGKFKCGRHSR